MRRRSEGATRGRREYNAAQPSTELTGRARQVRKMSEVREFYSTDESQGRRIGGDHGGFSRTRRISAESRRNTADSVGINSKLGTNLPGLGAKPTVNYKSAESCFVRFQILSPSRQSVAVASSVVAASPFAAPATHTWHDTGRTAGWEEGRSDGSLFSEPSEPPNPPRDQT